MSIKSDVKGAVKLLRKARAEAKNFIKWYKEQKPSDVKRFGLFILGLGMVGVYINKGLNLILMIVCMGGAAFIGLGAHGQELEEEEKKKNKLKVERVKK